MSMGLVYDYWSGKLDLSRLPFYRELEWFHAQTSTGFMSGLAVGYLTGWMLTWKIILIVFGLLFYDVFRKRYTSASQGEQSTTDLSSGFRHLS